MNISLHQLQIFLKVNETQSITKAAEELHLTQPAVSIQIKNLQDQFEIPIIEIVGKKVFITDFGMEIVAAALRINEEINAITSKAAAYRGELIGKLKITVVSTGKYVMPYFLSDFMRDHKGIELILDVTNRARVKESLEKNEVDFALVSVLPENLQVEIIDLMENKLFLVGGKGNEIRNKKADPGILTSLPLIFREPGSGTRHIMEKYIKDNNFKVMKKMELTSNEAVKQALLADLGYSIMPLIGIGAELERGDLRIIPVKGFPIRSTWTLIWLKNKKLSPVASAFINFIRAEKSGIIKRKFAGFDKY
jgi:LysR family transcriptional regulator, low CO2-responsive transcriptional regulator